MKVTIHTILGLKQALGAGQIEIDLPEAATVKEFLSMVKERWGDQLSSYLFQPGTDLLVPHVRVMVNGQTIEYLNRLDTTLKEADEVLLLPLAAGG